MLGGLTGTLAAGFTTQGGGQILPHLLPLSLLDVVLGGILQVGLHLENFHGLLAYSRLVTGRCDMDGGGVLGAVV